MRDVAVYGVHQRTIFRLATSGHPWGNRPTRNVDIVDIVDLFWPTHRYPPTPRGLIF